MENKKEISLYKSGKVYSQLEIEELQKKSTSSKFIEQEYASMTGIKGNETMQELLEKYGIPCLGGEEVFAEVDRYGYTYNGICSGFKWKDTVSEISNEEAWKIIALSSIYWEKRYEKWYEERDLYKKQFNELEPRFFDLREENKQLKDRIAELESENEEQYKRIMELEQDLVHADENVFFRECNVTLRENEIKEQAIKQFSERVKGKFEHCVVDLYLADTIDKKIDETLKEFLGEKND